ncbi:SPFH domain-containing protein [Desulfococcaceae bacterium HSG8]|nr:SPFH domain-containing protein [Desulfococcaceae bacterium HSG8]
MPEERRERDLILAPNEYAFILDETKGNIVNYVGPHKTSLANTDQPVLFNDQTKRFDRCNLEKAIKPHAISPEGWYVVLKNPARDGKPPTSGTANSLPELDIGRKVNIPGPVSLAPWPGQMIRVIQGHNLRSNQYLIARVYEEEAARINWKKAVIKPQTSSVGEVSDGPEDGVKPDRDTPDLTMGKLLVIRGIDVSFYIPPTGIEVVPDQNGRYARNAVTLERLEYCILLDEDGNKRYIRGPAVVFPRPTETFVEKNRSRKFKAVELNEISGLYVKVIAAYEEDGREYKEGEELFITGKEQMIYFPRSEHAIIRYGDQEVNYSVAIPAGEARYVLNRMSGQITLRKGPCMLLPDPRKEVIARRVIDPGLVKLWFPGNHEALEYNSRLMNITRKEKSGEFVEDQQVKKMLRDEDAQTQEGQRTTEFSGDQFTRKQTFSRPRTVTLDTKYEGAVSINVWTGYAVLVISKTGNRKVIAGPQTCLLEYDETLETVELSTGTPKTEDHLIQTVYLRVLHNKVSDIVEAETRDLCQVQFDVSYRVNFEGEPEKWFNVENYVKFLTDHIRSMLRHAIRQYGIEEFYTKAISIVRDTVLGLPGEDGKRPGALFEENNMRIYDVEVLDVIIGDEVIDQLLVSSQHTTVRQTLEIASEKKKLEVTEQRENIRQEIAKIEAATSQLMIRLEEEDVRNRMAPEMAKIESAAEAQKRKLGAKLADQKTLDQIYSSELAREKAKYDMGLDVTRQEMVQRLEELKAEVQAVVSKAKAVSPQLVAALQDFSDKALAERMAEAMSPLAILGGKSVAEVFGNLLRGTVLENVLALSETHTAHEDDASE